MSVREIEISVDDEEGSPEDGMQETHFESNIKVVTKYSTADILSKDCVLTKQERITFPYNCPICFRNFARLLESTCCQNYFCHFCIADI